MTARIDFSRAGATRQPKKRLRHGFMAFFISTLFALFFLFFDGAARRGRRFRVLRRPRSGRGGAIFVRPAHPVSGRIEARKAAATRQAGFAGFRAAPRPFGRIRCAIGAADAAAARFRRLRFGGSPSWRFPSFFPAAKPPGLPAAPLSLIGRRCPSGPAGNRRRLAQTVFFARFPIDGLEGAKSGGGRRGPRAQTRRPRNRRRRFRRFVAFVAAWARAPTFWGWTPTCDPAVARRPGAAF